MTESIRDVVLIGGGLAAAKAAETLRAEGFTGSVRLVTEEQVRPYERPPLSKSVLTGDQPPEVAYVHDEGYYRDHDIELVLGDPVTAIHRDASEVVLRSGRRLAFDRLLLATGAVPRRLPLGAADLDGILELRTLDDSTGLGRRLREVEHVTVVGAGWIGCEVAAAARTVGASVTMVDPLGTPLQRVLGAEVGGVFRDLHLDHGVDLRLGVGVSDLSGRHHVDTVTLSDGTELETDLVVVGIGVRPRTELAEGAGLDVDDGVVVDATLATSDPRILAAGDVANAWHPGLSRRLRVEHWANALNQGETAGRNLLGRAETYDRLPYFYSDQYDLGMEYVGHAADWDEVVFRGDREAREFIAFWLRDGAVAAAMNVNVWDVVEDLKGLVGAAGPLDPAALADPDVPLDALATAAR